MKNRIFQKIWLLFFGTAMTAAGVLFLTDADRLFVPLTVITGIIIGANGAHQLISAFAGKMRARTANGIINILAGAFICVFPTIVLGMTSLVFSVYIFINAAVKLIDFIASAKNGNEDLFADFIALLFFTVFGIITLISSFEDQLSFKVIVAIYCIMYGVTKIKDFIHEVTPSRAKNRIRRKLRVSLPAFVSAFVPIGILKNYNRRITSREIDIDELLKQEKVYDDDKTPNVHVFVHVSDDGVGVMGHCDLCIDGIVLSYGNYDRSSERLFGGIGDGVMFLADRKVYIDYSIKHDNKMIFDYGLLLSDEQMKRVREEITGIRSIVYRWYPPYEKSLMDGENKTPDEFSDYCSKLYSGTKAQFYKFRSGKFKSYCVLSTNCVLLADSILAKAGTDIIKTTGIISPGAYYDYLQTEYQLENGIVVTRDIYSKYKEIDG